jgi:hypothetical protein
MAEAQTIVLKVNLDIGVPGPEHFSIEIKPAPSCPADGILVQALVFSADPYQVNAIITQMTLDIKNTRFVFELCLRRLLLSPFYLRLLLQSLSAMVSRLGGRSLANLWWAT